MSVIDVSAAGDWSVVQVAYDPASTAATIRSRALSTRARWRHDDAEAAPAEATVVTASTKGAH